MEYFPSYGIAFLEMTFILVSLLLLHNLKQTIGAASYYLAIGAILVFSQIVSASGLHLRHPDFPGLSINIGAVIFIAPFMALILITYILDGTLEAQRLIWGCLCGVGIFIYLTYLTQKQVYFPNFHISDNDMKPFMDQLFKDSQRYMLALLLSILLEFLILPIIYEICRVRIGVSASIAIALLGTQVIDAFFYLLVTDPTSSVWWDSLRHSVISRTMAMIWISLLVIIYMRMRHSRARPEQSTRRPMDMILSFVGAYGQTQKLQANVQEWEGRYRMVVENAHDLIILVGETGRILDANSISLAKSDYTRQPLLELNITDLMQDLDWDECWEQLFEKKDGGWIMRRQALEMETMMKTRKGELLAMEITLSPLYIQKNYGALIVARDISQRREMEEELATQRAQLMHSQRMEAVGKLAGGIAHDFNNLLHAIQGSLDNLEKTAATDKRSKQLIENISTATDRAANLTNQLLGFARGGKYRVEEFNLNSMVQETVELFRPLSGKNIKLRTAIHPDPMQLEGDYTQLQQVILNLLINAMDSLPDKQGTITVRAEPALEHTSGMIDKSDGDYAVIRIKDNGCGISPDDLPKIFEPFFTTKDETKGTGMGLAMAYGCIQNHNGWIHVSTELNKGTEFFIFLPRLS